jgi:molybdopterin/thiamine biosynthesis adenylyltransferase
MNDTQGHEINYRSKKVFEKMAKTRICVCGAGALGSNLVNNLVRQGFAQIAVVDMDRVEKHNIATQVYSRRDVGQMKANALKANIFQNTGQMLEAVDKELRDNNAKKILKGFDLIVDVFDNWKSRGLVGITATALSIPVVHAGMSDNGFAEIKWNDNYKIPVIEVEQKDICDYPLAANLVQLTSAVLAEAVVQFVSDGETLNREITLKDLRVHIV